MFYGLMPRQIPVELAVVQVGRKDADGNFQAWLLWIRRDRRFAALKRRALKKLLPVCKRLPRFKLLFTFCEVFLAN
jgi:membrane protein required for beta-lactamase induction